MASPLDRLSPGARQEVMRLARPFRVRAGEVLFYPQDFAHAVYLLEEGLVRLFAAGSGDKAASPLGEHRAASPLGEHRAASPLGEHREATLAVVGPGGILGEAAFQGGRYGVYAEALLYTEGVSFSALDLALLVDQNPEVARFFLDLTLDRLRAAEGFLAELRFFSLSVRLAKALLRHFPDGDAPLSHQALAALVGSSREAVTKLLGEWALRGVVELGYRRVRVLDKEGLARIAAGGQGEAP